MVIRDKSIRSWIFEGCTEKDVILNTPGNIPKKIIKKVIFNIYVALKQHNPGNF
jgi:hypothetical protein